MGDVDVRIEIGCHPERSEGSAVLKSRLRVALGMTALLASAALAQSTGGTIRGRLVAAGDTMPVGRATVEIVDESRRMMSDSLGRFSFSGLKPGRHQLRVRRIGFEAFGRYVDASADSATSYEIPFKQLAVQLKEVTIAGKT